MIIVTGGAGMIGANLIKGLNDRGEENILVVDNLTRGEKFHNLADLKITDYLDKTNFLTCIGNHRLFGKLQAVFHLGACSDTMERNGRYMLDNNYRYTRKLLEYCQEHAVPLIYASSASVYGAGSRFQEKARCEEPLNVYAYSKLLFDQQVRKLLPSAATQIVGLRYFNVYGPRESHKQRMASVAYHFYHQYLQEGQVRLFEGSGGYENGAQRRDFVYVKDCVDVNLYFLDHPQQSGIFNVGTGHSQTFNEVAMAVINHVRASQDLPGLCLEALHKADLIHYIPFPEDLKGKYQSYTEADLSALRTTGCDIPFKDVVAGVNAYLTELQAPRLAS